MKRYAAPLLAGGAVVTIVTELLRYWIADHAIEPWVVIIASLFGFLGFYLINPAGAKDAFGFAVDQGVKIIGVARSGRRSTDPVVAVTEVIAPPEATPSSSSPNAATATKVSPVVGELRERYELPPPKLPDPNAPPVRVPPPSEALDPTVGDPNAIDLSGRG